MSRRTTPNPPVPPNLSDDNLDAWLKKQAAKLKNLEAKGNRLKIDFVQNAKEKGEILLEAEERVSTIPGRFYVWVVNDAQLGRSTARLYMDVAKHYDEVKERFANSNPLELTLRNVRDAIRDARQDRGEGKPGSGRRNEATTETPPTAEAGDEDATEKEEPHTADAGNQNDAAAIADKKFEKLMSRSEPGGDMHNGAGDTTRATRPASYKLTVVTPAKADLEKFGKLLPSPITDLNAHSVSGRISLQDIHETLAKVGTTLSTTQPKRVRIIVEL